MSIAATLWSYIITPWQTVDQWIDQTGMYRVVTLGLLFLVMCSIGFAVLGIGAYSITEQLLSLTAAVGTALVVNVAIAKATKIHANHESALITGLIMFFLFTPAFSITDHYIVALASALAMLSKYVVVWKKQHIFNAAAFGAVCLSFTGWHEAWWWVASPELFLPLVIAGVFIVQKIRRWPMVLTALAIGLLVVLVEALLKGDPITGDIFWFYFVTGPMLFLVFFMLTEPFTTPPTEQSRLGYAVVVATLANTTLLAPYVAMTPELALLIGNAAAYPSTLRQKLILEFKSKTSIAHKTFEFVFTKPDGIRYRAGQYLEWMLPHSPTDSRGIRRYFTIASAPEEADLRLALRVEEAGGSTYKEKLMQLEPGDTVIASQRAGDFLLQPAPSTKYALVAGGIGVTPFRSFVGHFTATQQTVDAVLFYGNNTESEIAYREYFEEAQNTIGLRTVHILSKEDAPGFEHGYFNDDIVQRHTPDYLERYWYLSGPPVMVRACKTLLIRQGVPKQQIVTDFFPGLA